MIDGYFGLYLFVIVYAIVLFMIAAILVPHRMQGVTRTYDYFVVAITGFMTERRSLQLGAAAVALAAQLIYLFQELGVLGGW